MIGALAYLSFQSWKNRLKMRIFRLKKPKYLGGAIFGLVYFYSYFYRYLLNPRTFKGSGLAITPENAGWIEPLGALLLFVWVVGSWVFPRERAALVFSEAEVAFLFPAPVSRKTLVHYKLWKSQLRILLMVFFLTIFFGRFLAGGVAWIHAISWWVILSTLNLHNLGASFALTLMLERGISNWKRRLIALVLLAAIVTGVALWAKNTIPAPDVGAMRDMGYWKYYAEHALAAGPAYYILYPFRLVVRPWLQTDALDFLKALGPALLVMALHYLWVMKSNVAFEEASVEASKKMAERIATMRANRGQLGGRPKKKKRAPFKLNPMGGPALGFLWKNLIATGQIFNLRFFLILVVIASSAGSMSLATRNASGSPWVIMAGMMALMALGMSILIGPQILRQDFRHDLPMTDILKTYPMAGWQVALGELFAPMVILTCVQWLLIIFCVGTLTSFGPMQISQPLRLGIASGLAILAPGLNFVTLIIPNAAVLLFPGWFQTGKDAPQGIEATGQRLIFALGQLVVFVLALAPAAAVFAVIFYIFKVTTGMENLALPVASSGALVVLGGEAALGMLMLGKLFERFDVAGDGAT